MLSKSIKYPLFSVKQSDSHREDKQAQNLRFKVFSTELDARSRISGLFKKREVDEYDDKAKHIIVKVKESFWQPEKVIGAYRLLEYNNRESLDESYSAQMGFDLDLLRTTDYNNFLELGRTCILPKYRKSPALKLLWKALYNYIVSNNIDVLFGCASFWTINPGEIANELSYLKKYHLMDEDIMVFPTGKRYEIAPMNSHCNLPENVFRKLPSLIKAYIGVGAKFGDGAVIDYSFKSIDVFTYVDCHSFDERIKKYYGRK